MVKYYDDVKRVRELNGRIIPLQRSTSIISPVGIFCTTSIISSVGIFCTISGCPSTEKKKKVSIGCES